MYHDFFGIAENPFSITPDPRYLYMSKGHQEALAHLLYGVREGGGFVLLTGEVGTGKTSVCRCLLEQLPEAADVALILNPRLDEIELLASICDELGVAYPADTRSLKVLVDLLNRHLLEVHAKGRHAVVIIDEAQNLSAGVLEQVRLLTNLETAKRKLLQIILIGQPELGSLLERDEMRQLVQRITARYHLQPLSRRETRAYIAHRLEVGGLAPDVFAPAAIGAIHRRARGVPRLINNLCDRCLLGAYVQNRKSVGPRMVRQAAKEVLGKGGWTEGRSGAALPWVAASAVLATALVLTDPADLDLMSGVADWPGEVESLFLDPSVAGLKADVEVAEATTLDGAPAAPDTNESLDAGLGETRAPATVAAEVVEEDTVAIQTTVAEGAQETASVAPAGSGTTPPEVREQLVADESSSTTDSDPAVGSMPAPPVDTPIAVAPSDFLLSEVGAPLEAALAGAAAPAGFDTGQEAEATKTTEPDPDSAVRRVPKDVAAIVPVPMETAWLSSPAGISTMDDLALDELFAQGPAPVDGETAFAVLLALWGLQPRGVDGELDCRGSAGLGVKCMVGETAWGTLVSFNRPALITLADSNGRSAHVVLTSVDAERVVLRAGAWRIVTDPQTLRPLWTGEFLLLWRPPAVYDRMLAFGARGKDVAWLEGRLAEIHGEPRTEGLSGVFDSALRDKVIAFQESRGLKADGIVGTRTLIHLNTVAEDSGVPLLQPLLR
jgi:general secretion pathway protein A